MNMVIVSLTYTAAGTSRTYDMEMPCHIPAKTLAEHICQTLDLYTGGTTGPSRARLQLYCRRLGRVLGPQETLEQAGVWNGDHIDMQ